MVASKHAITEILKILTFQLIQEVRSKSIWSRIWYLMVHLRVCAVLHVVYNFFRWYWLGLSRIISSAYGRQCPPYSTYFLWQWYVTNCWLLLKSSNLGVDRAPSPTRSVGSDTAPASLENPNVDDIKVEYHEKCGRQTEIFRLQDYGVREARRNKAPPDKEPWWPFRSCLDFEAAELALQTSMTDNQTNILFNLLCCASSGKDQFTLQNYDEAVKLWDLASYEHTGVCYITFLITF